MTVSEAVNGQLIEKPTFAEGYRVAVNGDVYPAKVKLSLDPTIVCMLATQQWLKVGVEWFPSDQLYEAYARALEVTEKELRHLAEWRDVLQRLIPDNEPRRYEIGDQVRIAREVYKSEERDWPVGTVGTVRGYSHTPGDEWDYLVLREIEGSYMRRAWFRAEYLEQAPSSEKSST